MKIITVEEIRRLEILADEAGHSFADMMENAGRETAQAIHERLGMENRCALILVGPGNNGGDGLVAAHYLKDMGARVVCYIWKRKTAGDLNFQRVEEDNIPIFWAEADLELEVLCDLLSSTDVVVDALLGVGVARPIAGMLEGILELVRQATTVGAPRQKLTALIPHTSSSPVPLVVAVDCPTGLDCDSGALDPAAVPADVTVTFAYPKAGLLRFPGAQAVGDLVVADIGVPTELADGVLLEVATPEAVRALLPARPHSVHKGTVGRALIVAGSVNYVGAAALAGAGATRVGTGLVTMGLPMPIQPAVAASLAEATYLLLPHDLGVVSSGAAEVVRDKMGDYGALLLGPGLTQEKESIAFVHDFLNVRRGERKGRMGFVVTAEADARDLPVAPPLVIDADGLNALSTASEWWRDLPPETIITPHPGEMSRLMGGELAVREIQADREGVALRMAAKWGTILILKGAFTVVAAPNGRVMVMPFANPGLATAGSGDVLAGAVVGLRAQGMGAFEAAVAGAYLHGLAGEFARSDLGDMGMVAGDLLQRLPLALRRIRTGE